MKTFELLFENSSENSDDKNSFHLTYVNMHEHVDIDKFNMYFSDRILIILVGKKIIMNDVEYHNIYIQE